MENILILVLLIYQTFKLIVKKLKILKFAKNKLLKEENFETSRITRQLKLKAPGGNYYNNCVVKKM